jgi:RNA polymerase sigma factor (sigma-70 family)
MARDSRERSTDVSAAFDGFAAFFADVQPRLQRAFIAMYGHERGRDATAEALAYAWEHWNDVRQMVNPTGYLFRVGQSRTRPRRTAVERRELHEPRYWFEPDLAPALKRLSGRQRTAVVLVHGFEWSLQEVAELIGCRKSTVQRHLERGLEKLRRALEAPE